MPVFILHELQVVDSQIDRLKQQKQTLPEKKAYEEAKLIYEQTNKQQLQVAAQLERQRQQQKKLEDEVANLSEKITREENRLYSGQIKNIKELQAIEEEVKALKRKKETVESQLLDLMEEVEVLSQQDIALLKKAQAEHAHLDLTQGHYEQALSQIASQLDSLNQQREQLLKTVSPQDLKLYEHLRQEKKGVAVVNLDGSTCSGCHLELPASDIDKVYAEQYWRCPHCRRIVVRKE